LRHQSANRDTVSSASSTCFFALTRL